MSKNNNFKGLEEALDVPFIEETSIVQFENPKNPEMLPVLVNQDKDSEVIEMTDEDYIRLETKKNLDLTNTILEKLAADIKIGASPKMYEAFAKLTDSFTNAVSELRELNKNSASIKLNKRKKDIKVYTDQLNVQNNNNTIQQETPKPKALTSSELSNMLADASKISQLKQIEAKFDFSREKII